MPANETTSGRDKAIFDRMCAIAKAMASEDDNLYLWLMTDGDGDLPLESTTEPRVCRFVCTAPHRSGIRVLSDFARNGLAAVAMGSADGKVGRPIPPHAGSTYLKAYDDAFVRSFGPPSPAALLVPWTI